MVGGLQSGRSLPHLAELLRLADAAGPAARPRAGRRRACAPARGRTESTAMSRLTASPSTRRPRSSWPLPELVAGCVDAGRPGGRPVARAGRRVRPRRAAAKLVRDAGLTVTSLCRGGFFTATPGLVDDDNRRAIDEAATLGTDALVLVCGGLPAGSRDLDGARGTSPTRSARWPRTPPRPGVTLAIEPLHPMFCRRPLRGRHPRPGPRPRRARPGRRGRRRRRHLPPVVGRPGVPRRSPRAGRPDRAPSSSPTGSPRCPTGVLLGRGLPGDGCDRHAPAAPARCDAAGYTGPIEVEVFHEDCGTPRRGHPRRHHRGLPHHLTPRNAAILGSCPLSGWMTAQDRRILRTAADCAVLGKLRRHGIGIRERLPTGKT